MKKNKKTLMVILSLFLFGAIAWFIVDIVYLQYRTSSGSAEKLEDVPYVLKEFKALNNVSDIRFLIRRTYRDDFIFIIASVSQKNLENWLLLHSNFHVDKGCFLSPPPLLGEVLKDMGGTWSEKCWVISGGAFSEKSKQIDIIGFNPDTNTLWIRILHFRSMD